MSNTTVASVPQTTPTSMDTLTSPTAPATPESSSSLPLTTPTDVSTPPPVTTPSSTLALSTPDSTTLPVTTPSSTIVPSSTPIITPSSTPITSETPIVTPSTTLLSTTLITISSTPDSTGTVTTFVTPTSTPISTDSSSSTTSAAPTTSTTPGQLQNNSNGAGSSSGGLSTGGITAIAVVIPVVVVAAIVLLLIWLFRKRKQRKAAEEARRKEVEEYGYNPNTDPTLPAVGSASNGPESPPAMSEDTGGYRGWGGAATTMAGSTQRKPSTNLSNGGGMAFSDDGMARTSPGAAPQDGSLGGHSADPLVDGAGAATAAGAGAGAAAAAAGGIRRGPSNASSSYSAAGPTEGSEDGNANAEYGYDTNYSQYTPYRPGAAGYEDQPVIRDVSARRQTKLENPSVYPQQGNSTGIAQNF